MIGLNYMLPGVMSTIPSNGKFTLKIGTILMDNIPKGVIVKRDLSFSIYFWTAVEKYFNDHRGRIIDWRDTDWDIPNIDVLDRKSFASTNGEPILIVGDRIMTPDYTIHRVIGFTSLM